MAQINFTLSEEEILQVLTGDRDEGMRFLLEKIVNIIMKAESEEQLGASKYERSDERKDYRNGTRERELTTRIGTLTLQVPRHSDDQSAKQCLFSEKRYNGLKPDLQPQLRKIAKQQIALLEVA